MRKVRNIVVSRAEFILALIAVVFCSITVYLCYRSGLMKVLIDENSHLNLTRLTIDSLTPGISQIGFWPPLLHIAMIPATMNEHWYRTGLAGFVTLLPFLILATIFFYKLIVLLTENPTLGFAGALLFLLNPYILYFSSTPMMEVLYLANLFSTTYFFVKWIKKRVLKYLVLAALFTSFTTLSRYEGIVLVPIMFALLLFILLLQKKKYHEIESLVLIYGFLAFAGILFILLYGYIFGQGNPLSFIGSKWSAGEQQKDFLLPAKFNVIMSTLYILHAAFYMISMPLVFLALILLPTFFLFGLTLDYIAALILLLSPFFFDFLAVFRGNGIISVIELPPFQGFMNVRYGLYLIGFCLLIPILFLHFLCEKFPERTYALQKIAVCGLVLFALFFYYKTSMVDSYYVLRKEGSSYPAPDQMDMANVIKKNYDFGKIFITRGLHDIVVLEADLPIKTYISETNYNFYAQTLDKPWLFARYVVMYDKNSPKNTKWSEKNEEISNKWAFSPTFNKYYTLIYSNGHDRLYKVNEVAVEHYIKTKRYNTSKIPSLNSNIDQWNPVTFYRDI